MAQEFLTVRELSSLAGVSCGCIRSRLWYGKLEFLVVGPKTSRSRIRIPMAAAEKFLQNPPKARRRRAGIEQAQRAQRSDAARAEFDRVYPPEAATTHAGGR
jgi:hypothetical protein